MNTDAGSVALKNISTFITGITTLPMIVQRISSPSANGVIHVSMHITARRSVHHVFRRGGDSMNVTETPG